MCVYVSKPDINNKHLHIVIFTLCLYRNPDRGARPSARSIVQELSDSQLKLLAISFTQELSGQLLKLALSEDLPPILPACTLGAPLEEGRVLYQDLQTKYN